MSLPEMTVGCKFCFSRKGGIGGGGHGRLAALGSALETLLPAR